MNKILKLIFICMITVCCNKKSSKNKMDIIYYGTEEFDFFEEKAQIKKQEAWIIQKNFLKEKDKDTFVELYILF